MHILIYTTTNNKAEAKKIAYALLKKKLISCSNIINNVTSIYEWEGKIIEDGECILFMKSVQRNFKAIENEILKLHSYDCPCVISMAINKGNKPFLEWSSQSCKKK